MTGTQTDTLRSVPAQGMPSPSRFFGQMKDHVTYGFAIAGSCPTPGMRLTITGLSLSTPTPSLVTFHPRQNPATNNIDHGWLDEFAIQVITTATTQISCRVLRIDTDSGWGQDLRLDFLVIEQT